MSAFPADETRPKKFVDPVESMMSGGLSPSTKEEARRKNDEALAAAQRAMLAAHYDVKADNEVSLIRKISDTKISLSRRFSGTPATINPNIGESSGSVATSTTTEEPVKRFSGTSLISAIRGNSNTNISGERNSSKTSIISALRGNSNTNISAEKKPSGTSIIGALRGNSTTSITGERKSSGTSLIAALRGNSTTNIEAPKKISSTRLGDSMQSQLLGFNKWFWWGEEGLIKNSNK